MKTRNFLFFFDYCTFRRTATCLSVVKLLLRTPKAWLAGLNAPQLSLYLLPIVLLLASLPAFSQPMPLHGTEYRSDTRLYCKIRMDCTRSETFPDALKNWKNGEFQAFDQLELPGKFGRGACNYWIALEVENQTADTFPLLLYATRLSDDSIWHFSKNRLPEVKIVPALGEMDATGTVPYPLIWASVWQILPGNRDTFLLKYYNFKPGENFLPRASDARVFAAQDLSLNLQQNWVFLFGFGAAFSIFLYAFALWVGTRDPAYGWYAAYCAVIAYVAWWNFEYEVLPLRFLSGMYEWTYSKTFIHTLLLGVCYAQFLRHFFRGKPPLIRRAVWGYTWFCAGAALTELVLLNVSLHWSWVFYYWLRVALVSAGLGLLYFIWKIPGRQSRLIMYGVLSLTLAELLSNLFPTHRASHAALLGVLLDLFFFTIALAERNRQELQEKTLLQLEAQRLAFEQERENERLRTRIAQDIHDEVGGILTKISLSAQVASRLPDLSETELKARMEKLGADARHATGHLREIVFAINPDFDRFEEMQAYFRESAREFWSETAVMPHFKFEKNGANPVVPPDVKRQLLLIFKEAQNNVAKHADAKKVWLTFTLNASAHYFLEVRDDGQGFDVQHKNGYTQGLSGMKKRAERIGTTLFVESAQGKGTVVRVEGMLEK